jgi:hypothetical protein
VCAKLDRQERVSQNMQTVPVVAISYRSCGSNPVLRMKLCCAET